MPNISFDRVADIYDQTRGHPPEVAEQVAEAAQRLIPTGSRVLEVGVGTGRIARPLLQRGVDVTGIDVSRNMLRKLVEQLPPGRRVQLAQADVNRLPFPAAAFPVVLSVHVLHLIETWQQALQEMLRLLAPGGALLTGFDQRDPASPIARTNDQWRLITGRYIQHAGHPGPRDFKEVDNYLLAAGARKEIVEAAVWETEFVPGEYIQKIEAGVFSYSWRLDPERMPECAGELRTWAMEQFGSLERRYRVLRSFIWERYTFGG